MADDPKQPDPEPTPEPPAPTPAEHTTDVGRMVEGREPDPVIYEGDIDQRMAALLKDHQEMGSRPAEEPQSVDEPQGSIDPQHPADFFATVDSEPEDKPAPKKAAKKK